MKKLLSALILSLFFTFSVLAGTNPVLKIEGDYFCRPAKNLKFEGKLENWRQQGALPLFLSGGKHVVIPDWNGPEDVSLTAWLLYDENNLYLAAKVHDENPNWQNTTRNLYRGSGFQIAVDPLSDTIIPGYDGNDIEFGFGRLDDGNAAAHTWAGGEAMVAGQLYDLDIKITDLSENDFFYEVKIPWRLLKPLKPELGSRFGFNILYNAAKNGTRRGWIHWTPGIGEEKLSFMFRNVRLCLSNEGVADSIITTDKEQYSSGDSVKITSYLPTDIKTTGVATLKIKENEKIIHEEKKDFATLKGGTVLDFNYETGRLRGNGLDVILDVKYSDKNLQLNTEILNLSIPILQAESERIAKRVKDFREKMTEVENKGIPIDYPRVAAAVCETTLRHRNRDLSSPDRVAKFALLAKINRQFIQLNSMLDRAEIELRNLATHQTVGLKVPNPEMKNFTIKNGSFYANGELVLLIGPHGWWPTFSDIDMIAEAGFNMIGGTVLAQDATTAPGRKRTDFGNTMLRNIRNMEKHNLAFDFLISPHPTPKGWVEAHPEMKEYSGGGWIASSFYNDATRRMVDEMWAVMIPMMKEEPNLASWNLVNEWCFSDGLTKVHPTMKARFVQAMKARYGTIDKLNATWKTSHANFEAIDPLQIKRGTPGAFFDWETFRYNEGLENMNFLYDTARKYDTKIPCQVKTIAVTDLDPAQYTAVGVEREDRGEVMDMSGSDCAATIHLDYYRSVTPDKPATDTEFHVSISTTPEEIVTDCWSAMLHGEGMRQYFAWSNSYSAEMLAAGAMLHFPESLEALGRTTLDIRRLVPEITAFQRAIPNAEVGILYSPTSKYCDKKYPSILRQCHSLLTNLDTQIRFISERQLNEKKEHNIKIIIIPGATYILPETLSALQDFINSGGTVLKTKNAASKDQYNNSLPKLKGAKEITISLDTFEKALSTVHRPVRVTNQKNQILFGEIEVRAVEKDDSVLFYLINYGPDTTLTPVYNGKPLKEAKDLIKSKTSKFPIELKNRQPRLFEVKK